MTNDELTAMVNAITKQQNEFRRYVVQELDMLKAGLSQATTANIEAVASSIYARMDAMENKVETSLARERYTNNSVVLRKMVRDILREKE